MAVECMTCNLNIDDKLTIPLLLISLELCIVSQHQNALSLKRVRLDDHNKRLLHVARLSDEIVFNNINSQWPVETAPSVGRLESNQGLTQN
jgi:hypothetical protein